MWLIIVIKCLPDPKKPPAYWEVREGQTQAERVQEDKKASDLDKRFVEYFYRRHRAEIQGVASQSR